MNTDEMLNFLLENDVVLRNDSNGCSMTADEAFELGGEFVVYTREYVDLYRGTNFYKALQVMVDGFDVEKELGVDDAD